MFFLSQFIYSFLSSVLSLCTLLLSAFSHNHSRQFDVCIWMNRITLLFFNIRTSNFLVWLGKSSVMNCKAVFHLQLPNMSSQLTTFSLTSDWSLGSDVSLPRGAGSGRVSSQWTQAGRALPWVLPQLAVPLPQQHQDQLLGLCGSRQSLPKSLGTKITTVSTIWGEDSVEVYCYPSAGLITAIFLSSSVWLMNTHDTCWGGRNGYMKAWWVICFFELSNLVLHSILVALWHLDCSSHLVPIWVLGNTDILQYTCVGC